ncbi:gypsy retrotransposon integrase-like protein 1 [Plakobranchus ocellatus]|uniref:Gypsy retrotransposon integrase-like protein 1 n=1 Tax=Plakobranchus ocellatus TaxID=259542 RepID=A0AAV3YVQ7_9GAST|nr:gypsy retrotransposon integrase-like protein 1 [Plakobranchus ocellatus]
MERQSVGSCNGTLVRNVLSRAYSECEMQQAAHSQWCSFQEQGTSFPRFIWYQDLGRNVDVKQAVLPKPLREYVMSVAHDSITGAHLGIRRMKDKILSNFYWPGVDGDVTRYCRSCDVCQRTVKKGTVSRVLLEKVPLIDTPFKRVAIDLVGPINPPSEAGHRFILTLVDYATRFAEAVSLRKIDTESVAEALVVIYSRLGLPERC